MACITPSLGASQGRFAIPRAMESIEVGLGPGVGKGKWNGVPGDYKAFSGWSMFRGA